MAVSPRCGISRLTQSGGQWCMLSLHSISFVCQNVAPLPLCPPMMDPANCVLSVSTPFCELVKSLDSSSISSRWCRGVSSTALHVCFHDLLALLLESGLVGVFPNAGDPIPVCEFLASVPSECDCELRNHEMPTAPSVSVSKSSSRCNSLKPSEISKEKRRNDLREILGTHTKQQQQQQQQPVEIPQVQFLDRLRYARGDSTGAVLGQVADVPVYAVHRQGLDVPVILQWQARADSWRCLSFCY